MSDTSTKVLDGTLVGPDFLTYVGLGSVGRTTNQDYGPHAISLMG
jgi:hypothetical protein